MARPMWQADSTAPAGTRLASTVPVAMLAITVCALAAGCSRYRDQESPPGNTVAQHPDTATRHHRTAVNAQPHRADTATTRDNRIAAAGADGRMSIEPAPDRPNAPPVTVRPPSPAPALTPERSTVPPQRPTVPPQPSADSPQPSAVPAPLQEPKTASGKRVAYAPHIWIDWSIPRVEIESVVAQTEGAIELLLCSRGTKEHESILVTDASAQHIFEATGLIGLTPGKPVGLDPATGQTIPPTGDPVVVQIEWDEKVIPAHEWMLRADSSTPADAIDWVFAGSRDIGERFGAQADGTIICVVDFDTALIAPGESHTSDDAELWLEANPQRIPPRGTPCRVIVRPADPSSPMNLTVTREGQFQWDDRLLSPIELDTIIRRRVARNPDQPVHLSAAPGTDARLARVAARCIIGSGIKQDHLTLSLPDEPSPSPSPSPAP